MPVAVITFSWSSHGLSLIKRNLKKWILSTNSSCIRRKTTKTFLYVENSVLQKIFQKIHVVVELRRQSDIMEI